MVRAQAAAAGAGAGGLGSVHTGAGRGIRETRWSSSKAPCHNEEALRKHQASVNELIFRSGWRKAKDHPLLRESTHSNRLG